METSTIDRIKQVIKYKNLNARSFALAVGFNYSTLHNYITGRRLAVDLDLVLKTINTFDDISPEWLLTGEGGMLRSANERHIDIGAMMVEREQEEEEQEYYHITDSGDKYFEISNSQFKVRAPLIPSDHYGRYLAETKEGKEMKRKEWDTIEFIVKGISPMRYLAFEIKGDSMNDGSRHSLLHGDIALAKELKPVHWKKEDPYKKYPYWIVVTNGNIMCKKVVAIDPATGMITFHSLNPSPEYQDFQLHVDEIKQLFSIVKKTAQTF